MLGALFRFSLLESWSLQREAVSHGFLLETGEQAGPLGSLQEPLPAQRGRHVGMAAHGPGALLQKLQVGAKPSGMAPPFPSAWRQKRGQTQGHVGPSEGSEIAGEGTAPCRPFSGLYAALGLGVTLGAPWSGRLGSAPGRLGRAL